MFVFTPALYLHMFVFLPWVSLGCLRPWAGPPAALLHAVPPSRAPALRGLHGAEMHLFEASFQITSTGARCHIHRAPLDLSPPSPFGLPEQMTTGWTA